MASPFEHERMIQAEAGSVIDQNFSEGLAHVNQGGKMKKKLIVVLVLVGLLLILIVQNIQNISLNIFFWNIMMPEVILVLILFAPGFVVGFLAAKMTKSK